MPERGGDARGVDTGAPRRALVTGASGGIGRAVAVALARDGFELDLSYRSGKAAVEETAAAVRAVGAEPTLLQFDVACREACAEVLTAAVRERGAYYGVVCNAGVHDDAAFPAMRAEQWDRVLRTNLDGFYNVLHPLVLPMVRAHRGGRIVAITSVAGQMGHRGQANYAASKAGLVGAVKSIAQELAKRAITANCVAPGLIETEMVRGVDREALAARIPMRRFGRPEEVAAAVSYLFSDGAAYVTGHVLSVNGGMV
jgi:3-oxoacyl-[acyl-carrier protein] reductase